MIFMHTAPRPEDARILLTLTLRQGPRSSSRSFTAAMYLIQQFAKLAGVTVRTLHHYDRLGLLSPRHRSESGYRLYTNQDMVRLERIMVLRYLGLPLRQIADLLSGTLGDDNDVAHLDRKSVVRERV